MSELTVKRNTQPPAFSRANREARQVAQEEGCLMWDTEALRDTPASTAAAMSRSTYNPWYYRRGTDIIHLNRNPRATSVSVDTERLSRFLDLGRNAKAVCFDYYFFTSILPPMFTYGDYLLLELLEPGREYLVTLMSANIYATDEQAIASGLFEHLEAPVQLVDLTDHKTIRRMLELGEQGRYPYRWISGACDLALNLLVKPEAFASKLKLWRETMDAQWLKARRKAEEAKVEEGEDCNAPSWKEETLAKTTFRPMLMFRHCPITPRLPADSNQQRASGSSAGPPVIMQ
ncbi:hypothetical protein SLS62_009495 [Diatrype stigma]|uniref:Uncharacterized protein n=1 Tax=Diatrype stigma TaxID=117547 RepID=A0AAN9UFQ5_9PEZI